jgi:hypothetical protein
MKQMFLLLSICLIFFSCKKNKDNTLWECNNPPFLDSATISNKIIGSWVWTKQLCGDGAGSILIANKNIKITFNANTTFTVFQNSSILTQGNWKLKIVDNYVWGLDLTSVSEYLYGRILFCNNQVMFNDSYIDGCDNVFAKE